MREDWNAYCVLSDLGMEERVKWGLCVYVCVLHAFSYRLIDCSFSQLSRLYGVEPDRATWHAAHIAFMQVLVAPPEAVPQKEIAKLLKRPLPKGLADALFTYEGFLHCFGRMTLSA